ncbi:GtrA family protein [Xylanimonas allomyrinae]|uniref:GtrA family protein n=1 Tax=Xylanimonas allomyrinae TaxID=2509459 RepID=UPI0013A67F9D|nr:GtrA family protein [Xylanimonas allomyrinae]
MPDGATPLRRSRTASIIQSRLTRFAVVGGGAALLEFAVFAGLIAVGTWPALASLLSFAVGMTSSFVGYRRWTFSGDQALPMFSQFGAYLALAVVNAVVSATLVQVMVNVGLDARLAKVVMMAAVACWNFAILDRLVFRRDLPKP